LGFAEESGLPFEMALVRSHYIGRTFIEPRQSIRHFGVKIKFNPLANWTSQQVWEYIRENVVPYNPLHERGYVSIGCEPCTRPVVPGQHEREGRWWWEDVNKKECGLHSGNGK